MLITVFNPFKIDYAVYQAIVLWAIKSPGCKKDRSFTV